MKRFALVVALFCAVVMAAGERAAAQVALNETPAVISVGAGWYDFNLSDDEAVDFRLEYRHGDDFLFLKPWGGVEVTTDGSVWGGVGVLVDITFFDAVVLTGSFLDLFAFGGILQAAAVTFLLLGVAATARLREVLNAPEDEIGGIEANIQSGDFPFSRFMYNVLRQSGPAPLTTPATARTRPAGR